MKEKVMWVLMALSELLLIVMVLIGVAMAYKVIDGYMTSYLEPKEVTWTFIKEPDHIQAP